MVKEGTLPDTRETYRIPSEAKSNPMFDQLVSWETVSLFFVPSLFQIKTCLFLFYPPLLVMFVMSQVVYITSLLGGQKNMPANIVPLVTQGNFSSPSLSAFVARSFFPPSSFVSFSLYLPLPVLLVKVMAIVFSTPFLARCGEWIGIIQVPSTHPPLHLSSLVSPKRAPEGRAQIK